MSFFRKLYRILKAIFLFAGGILEIIITRPRTRPERAAWLSRFCRRVLRGMGITYSTIGPVPTSGAVIANHLSYIDILIHAAIRPCVFVSKAELRKTPVLGWISMMAGTVYVVRGGGGSAAKAAEGMSKGFRDKLPVMFFPEGTTGVGDELAMPFRSGLIAQAIEASEPMTPGFLRYDLAAVDRAQGKSARNDVHWGPQGLLEHIWNFVGLHDLHATVLFDDHPIAFSPEAIANRKVAADEARAVVIALGKRLAIEAPPAP